MSQLGSAPLLMIWNNGYPFSHHIPNLSSSPCPLSSLKPQKPYLEQVTLSHVTHVLKSTLFWRMRFLGTLRYVTVIAGVWNWAWISHNFGKIVEYKTDQGYFCYIYLFLAEKKKLALADGFSILGQAESSQTSGAGWACWMPPFTPHSQRDISNSLHIPYPEWKSF